MKEFLDAGEEWENNPTNENWLAFLDASRKLLALQLKRL